MTTVALQGADYLAGKPRPVHRAAPKKRRAPAELAPLDAFAAMAPHERAVLDAARAILRAKLAEPGALLDMPSAASEFVRLQLAGYGHECFAVLFLDTQLRVIAFDEMFHGTISQASVFPREVARLALNRNAAAVILAHNHPSGDASPSTEDRALTDVLKKVLALVDVRVLDHLVVGRDEVCSLAQLGLL